MKRQSGIDFFNEQVKITTKSSNYYLYTLAWSCIHTTLHLGFFAFANILYNAPSELPMFSDFISRMGIKIEMPTFTKELYKQYVEKLNKYLIHG
ncbi:MAG: hypothetical protein IJJ41_04115 [Clostridia bacterium]|nr:hypothetical protein [Clostridia bacterium]